MRLTGFKGASERRALERRGPATPPRMPRPRPGVWCRRTCELGASGARHAVRREQGDGDSLLAAAAAAAAAASAPCRRGLHLHCVAHLPARVAAGKADVVLQTSRYAGGQAGGLGGGGGGGGAPWERRQAGGPVLPAAASAWRGASLARHDYPAGVLAARAGLCPEGCGTLTGGCQSWLATTAAPASAAAAASALISGTSRRAPGTGTAPLGSSIKSFCISTTRSAQPGPSRGAAVLARLRVKSLMWVGTPTAAESQRGGKAPEPVEIRAALAAALMPSKDPCRRELALAAARPLRPPALATCSPLF